METVTLRVANKTTRVSELNNVFESEHMSQDTAKTKLAIAPASFLFLHSNRQTSSWSITLN